VNTLKQPSLSLTKSAVSGSAAISDVGIKNRKADWFVAVGCNKAPSITLVARECTPSAATIRSADSTFAFSKVMVPASGSCLLLMNISFAS
jgi:hypothetical protein